MGFRILRNTKHDIPVPDPPARVDRHEGLSYALFLPRDPARGGVVILHGAGSCKESHYDYARACRSFGFAAIAFDQRGHGESEGELDGRALDDVAAIASLLPPGPGGARPPLGLRGSSMGGTIALLAAQTLGAAAVVAICPASTEGLAGGLRAERFDFSADGPALTRLLDERDLVAAIAGYRGRVLLLHARGDEQVPVEHSIELAEAADSERVRLIVVPGGHHRSIQHDSELQGESLRFLRRALC